MPSYSLVDLFTWAAREGELKMCLGRRMGLSRCQRGLRAKGFDLFRFTLNICINSPGPPTSWPAWSPRLRVCHLNVIGSADCVPPAYLPPNHLALACPQLRVPIPCVYVCVFIKWRITVQSGPVIQYIVILCQS